MVTRFWLVGNYHTIVSMQYTATLIIYYCTATTKYLQSKSMQCNVLRYKFTDYGHVGASLFKLISSDKNTFWHMASKRVHCGATEMCPFRQNQTEANIYWLSLSSVVLNFSSQINLMWFAIGICNVKKKSEHSYSEYRGKLFWKQSLDRWYQNFNNKFESTGLPAEWAHSRPLVTDMSQRSPSLLWTHGTLKIRFSKAFIHFRLIVLIISMLFGLKSHCSRVLSSAKTVFEYC